MKILTAQQARDADQRTIAAGLPSLILMENAAHRVVEAMRERYGPLRPHHVVVLCGKGNNGGDGMAIARILHSVDRPRRLQVFLTEPPASADAQANLAMLRAAGVAPCDELTLDAQDATLVIDALLGTGAKGEPTGKTKAWIEAINAGFAHAKRIAVDLPSGLDADQPDTPTLHARADLTVTFTAPKHAHALPPNCDRMGELVVGQIGTAPALLDNVWLHWLTPGDFAAVLAPRPRGGHKGTFGHVLVIGGAPGKTGAAHMAALAALRAGAGLVTAACSGDRLPPEIMTAPLAEPDFSGKTVAAIGPGLGLDGRVLHWFHESLLPLVLDADALNSLAGQPWQTPAGATRILTPHPGEMKRLHPQHAELPRLAASREFATGRQVTLVLKGQRTLIAFPDGVVYVNPTGTPAMATGGSGDILTGLIAGLVAQNPANPRAATLAAVWLHGKAGELAAAQLGERGVIATDLLTYLPDAIRHAL